MKKSVLIFFYDILIYSLSIAVHVEHSLRVFELMREHKLYAKMSKCSLPQVEWSIWGTTFKQRVSLLIDKKNWLLRSGMFNLV